MQQQNRLEKGNKMLPLQHPELIVWQTNNNSRRSSKKWLYCCLFFCWCLYFLIVINYFSHISDEMVSLRRLRCEYIIYLLGTKGKQLDLILESRVSPADSNRKNIEMSLISDIVAVTKVIQYNPQLYWIKTGIGIFSGLIISQKTLWIKIYSPVWLMNDHLFDHVHSAFLFWAAFFLWNKIFSTNFILQCTNRNFLSLLSFSRLYTCDRGHLW